MVNRFHIFFERLYRVSISILVVVFLAGQPAVAALNIACAPDCSMHHDDESDMGCCASMITCRSSAAAAEARHQPPPEPPDSACDDLGCFDSTAEIIAFTAVGGGLFEGGPAVFHLGETIVVAASDSTSDVFLDFRHHLVSPPIYKRMCVYLI